MVFATPTGAGAAWVSLSSDKLKATFSGAGAVGVKSTVALNSGGSGVFYFEATRTGMNSVGLGISASAPESPAISGGQIAVQGDSFVVDTWVTLTADAAGNVRSGPAGDADTFGFVVDYRQKYPAVSIIGRAGNNPGACPGLPADDPCIYRREQLVKATGSLSIYAYGKGDGSSGASVAINAGADPAAKPYVYPMAGVHRALRAFRFEGHQALNMQWPTTAGPAASPTLTPLTHPRVVIRQGDLTPIRRGFSVASTASAASVVRWTDESNGGATLGAGDVLLLSSAAVNAMSVGDHRVIVSVADTVTGRYAEQVFTLTVISGVSNGDDDGDGLSYDQEKVLGTDPGKPDTDGDGLADGAEFALGMNPLLVDTNSNGVPDGLEFAATSGQPTVGMLVREAGTSSGVVISADGQRAAFTGDINQDCAQNLSSFTDPVYTLEICRKRGVRANTGIRAGEFRYFETRRLAGRDNMGHGVTLRSAQIDPFCCFNPGVLNPLTPPSMQFNSALPQGMINLVAVPFETMNGGDADQTSTYGFVVDYRSAANPHIYMVMRNASGQMVLTGQFALTGFDGADVVPYVYGHPLSDTEARGEINLGLRKFEYAPGDVATALTAASVSVTGFAPGVGLHRWAVP